MIFLAALAASLFHLDCLRGHFLIADVYIFFLSILLIYIFSTIRPLRPNVRLVHSPQSPMSKILQHCPSLRSFQPHWLIRGPHLQTFFTTLIRRNRNVFYDRSPSVAASIDQLRHIFEVPDGGCIAFDWCRANPSTGVTALVLHGLTGGSSSVRIFHVRLTKALRLVPRIRARLCWNQHCGHERARMRKFAPHSATTSCDPMTLQLPVGFNAGMTDDVRLAIKHIRSHTSDRLIGIVRPCCQFVT